MKICNPSLLLAIALPALMATSCVSNKIHIESLRKNESLEKQVVRSNDEVKELKDQKIVLEDEVKAKNVEITRLRDEISKGLKNIGECTDRVKTLNDELLQLKISLEGKSAESTALINSYEQKLGLLNHELTLAKKRKHHRNKNRYKMLARK